MRIIVLGIDVLFNLHLMRESFKKRKESYRISHWSNIKLEYGDLQATSGDGRDNSMDKMQEMRS